jgi:hypothetical protein
MFRGPLSPPTLRPLAALLLAAAPTATMPTPARGQLLGGLLDEPLTDLLGGLPGTTTRVIIRTDRGALAPVQQLVTALGGRVLAQHKLIGAVTVELPVVQLALVVRVPGVPPRTAAASGLGSSTPG